MDLLQQAQQGDQDAFAKLVDQYKSYVYTIVYRVIGTSAVAEEVSQDVFVKVYRKLNTFTGESKFSSWLFSVAYRTAIDQRRKLQRQPVTSEIQAQHQEYFIAENASDQTIIDTERKHFLQKAIDNLNEEQAGVITLFYLKEHTIQEICEISGMTKSKVKVLLFRARKKLKTILQNNHKNEIIDYE